jgi:hypothetical protein
MWNIFEYSKYLIKYEQNTSFNVISYTAVVGFWVLTAVITKSTITWMWYRVVR